MPLPKSLPRRYTTSRQLIAGDDFNNIVDRVESSQGPIAAAAGGGQANATPLNAAMVIVSPVATIGDSVLLPPGYVGLSVQIYNLAGNSITVFGSGNDTINTLASVNQAGGKSAIYTCMIGPAVGAQFFKWAQLLGA